MPDSAEVSSQDEPDSALDSEKETSGDAGGTVVNDDSESIDLRQLDVQATTMPFSEAPVPEEDTASGEMSDSAEVSSQKEPDPALDSEKETSGDAGNDDSKSSDLRQPDVRATTMPFSASPVPEEDTASREVSKSVEVSNQEEPDSALNSEKETSGDAGGTVVNDDSECNDPRQSDVQGTTMPFSAAPAPEEDATSGEVSESVEIPDQETPAAMQYYMEETVEDSGKTCSDETAFHASGIPGVSFVMSTVHPTGDSTPGIDLGTSTGEVFESSTVFGEATGPPGSS